jgi:hypothetical protein
VVPLGKQLLTARRACGLSRAGLATAAELSRSQIHAFESSLAYPRAHEFLVIVAVLDAVSAAVRQMRSPTTQPPLSGLPRAAIVAALDAVFSDARTDFSSTVFRRPLHGETVPTDARDHGSHWIDDLPELIRPSDFSEWCQLHPNSVYAGIAKGVIPAIRVAGQIRIRRAELIASIRPASINDDPYGQPADGYALALARDKESPLPLDLFEPTLLRGTICSTGPV